MLKGAGFLWVLFIFPGVLLTPAVLWYGLNEAEGISALVFVGLSVVTIWVFNRVTKRP
jgi:hypothetical protein